MCTLLRQQLPHLIFKKKKKRNLIFIFNRSSRGRDASPQFPASLCDLCLVQQPGFFQLLRMQHHKKKTKKKTGFKYRSRWRYRSALMLTYGRASNVSSNVLQRASPLCNVLHPEKTHLTWLLHQTSGRATLKSPTVPWPRLRCKKRGLIPTMSSEHRWERVRGGFTFRQSEHKKRNGNHFFFKKQH